MLKDRVANLVLAELHENLCTLTTIFDGRSEYRTGLEFEPVPYSKGFFRLQLPFRTLPNCKRFTYSRNYS